MPSGTHANAGTGSGGGRTGFCGTGRPRPRRHRLRGTTRLQVTVRTIASLPDVRLFLEHHPVDVVVFGMRCEDPEALEVLAQLRQDPRCTDLPTAGTWERRRPAGPCGH